MRRTVLALVALLGTTAYADPLPRDAKAWCANHERETFVANADGTWTPAWSAHDPDPPRYTVVWRGSLDGDRRRDVVLDQGDCGTHECMHAAYVQCSDATYALVMPADYASRVRVRRRARGWAVLEVEHVGDAERGRRARSWTRIRFGANGYDE